jgi:hypothetical protein
LALVSVAGGGCRTEGSECRVSQSWRRETAGALAGVLIIAVARPATALSASGVSI